MPGPPIASKMQFFFAPVMAQRDFFKPHFQNHARLAIPDRNPADNFKEG